MKASRMRTSAAKEKQTGGLLYLCSTAFTVRPGMTGT